MRSRPTSRRGLGPWPAAAAALGVVLLCIVRATAQQPPANPSGDVQQIGDVQQVQDVQDQDPGTVTERRIVAGTGAPAPDGPSSQLPQAADPAPAATAPAVASSEHAREAEKQYLKGAKALDAEDVRSALKYFSRAVDLDPGSARYRAAKEIAREHLVTLLVQEGEKGRMMGQSNVERDKLAQALALDPHNGIVTQHLDELAREALDPLSQDRASDTDSPVFAPPIELTPDSGTQSFHVRASSTALLQQVTSAYGLTAVLDDSVRGQPVRFDADDVTYAQAAQMLKLATGTFFVPLDPRRVIVANDTRANRDKYERLAEETIYLPGLTPAEVTDVGNVARNVFDIPTAAALGAGGTLTVRAAQGRMRALNAVLTELLGGHSQVELDVRVYEIARTRTRNIGLQLPQQTTFFNVDSEVNALVAQNPDLVNQIIASGLANAGDILKIAAILVASGEVSGSILSQPFVLFGGGLTATGIVPGAVSGNLKLNTSDVRSVEDVKLRIVDQGTATLRSGTRYPIITSTLSSTSLGSGIPGINTAGLSSTLAGLGIDPSLLGATTQTIPQIQYEDLGLTLKATPNIQMDRNVGLKLDLKIEALGGDTVDNIPVLNNRQFTAQINVKDGNSVMLVSNLNRRESGAVSGLPGLSELPGFGSATDKSTDFDESTLVVTITTRIVHQGHTQVAGQLIRLPLHD